MLSTFRILRRFSDTAKSNIKYDYLSGFNSVHAAIYNHRREKTMLYISENVNEAKNPRLSNIIQKANAEKIPIKVITKSRLDRLARDEGGNQNIVLQTLPVPYYLIHEPEHQHLSNKKEGLTWAMIDKISDPHNFGAIIRSAFYLGIDGVFVNIDQRCPQTSTVSRSSAGALELIDVFCMKDPMIFQTKCQSEGWEVICADKPPKNSDKVAINCNDNKNSVDSTSTKNRIIVQGSEGDGISQEILDLADSFYWVEDKIKNKNFPNTQIDSQNVSVACGIILHDLMKK